MIQSCCVICARPTAHTSAKNASTRHYLKIPPNFVLEKPGFAWKLPLTEVRPPHSAVIGLGTAGKFGSPSFRPLRYARTLKSKAGSLLRGNVYPAVKISGGECGR